MRVKLLSFEHEGKVSWGFASEGGLVDLGSKLQTDIGLLDVLCSREVRERVEDNYQTDPADFSLEDIRFRPPVPGNGKIVCVGLNYHAHVGEAGRPQQAQYPTLFSRWSDSHVGHGEPMVRPTVSEQFDYEGELALIIGKRGRHIAKSDAFSHVAGYSCYNDGSLRDWQSRSSQFLPGKNFVSSGAFGPWVVTADEIPDVTRLSLVTRLNGDVLQEATVADLIFDIPTLISYISTFTWLSPGDVIVTGTPSGVGAFQSPQIWMKPGDHVEVEISGVGILSNPIVNEEPYS